LFINLCRRILSIFLNTKTGFTDPAWSDILIMFLFVSKIISNLETGKRFELI
jgi:hypothetical protein